MCRFFVAIYYFIKLKSDFVKLIINVIIEEKLISILEISSQYNENK